MWREPEGGASPINSFSDLGLAGPQSRPNVAGNDLVDVAGVPHVAWSEWNGTAFQVRVAKLDGKQWVNVGGVLNANPARDATRPRLAVNEGALWITWLEVDQSGVAVVRVARRMGSGWLPIGGAVDLYPANGGGGYAGLAQLAFLGGVAYLGVMEDNGTDFVFRLLKLNAEEDWVLADTGKRSSNTVPRWFELTVSGGRLYMASTDFIGGEHLERLATNGRDWEPRPLPDATLSGQVQAADVGGVLHLLELGEVFKQSGDSWTSLGVVPAERELELSDVGGVPHVLVVDGTALRVMAPAAGGGWQYVDSGAANNFATFVDANLTAVGTVPYVSWAEFDGCNYEQRVARLEPGVQDDPALTSGPCAPPGEQPPNNEGGGTGNPGGGNPGGGNPGGGNPGGGNPGGGGDPTPVPPGPDPPVSACGIDIAGTSRSDSLTGDGARNTLHGFAGNDRLFGLGHADCLFGGAGNDVLDGGSGNDELDGATGNDRLKGGDDSDELFGASGNDRLTGDGDEDELSGGAGNDALAGGDGFDVVAAGSGNDVIDARGAGFDRIDCGPGRDRVKNAGRTEVLRNCERVSRSR